MACRCGGDMPGRCPGPANCPMEAPSCERCGTARRVHDSCNWPGLPEGEWLCEDCAAEALEQMEQEAA